MILRPLLRRFCYTQNTIRYRVEWRCLREAWRRIGRADHLFDGGAGSGEFARKTLDEGLCERVTAIEYDASNLSLLQRNLGRESAATTRHGSILDIPFADASFDVVQCTQVIEHIVEHEKAAAELSRVLKPGGHAIITVPHPPEPFPNEGHVREGYTEDDLKALFAPCGLTPLHTDWFLTRETLGWMMLASRLPLGGVYLPLALIDAEAGLSIDERRSRQPFGILVLFQKRP
ncbi:MAG: class I SAM-dependent methyltransferase [Verrucomicrobiaceae bacterium]|nr:class I SAM-dependent methyltransferase [Verrucomicrobiaceae bacterium]